jgi:hypothetical protein
MHMRRNYIVICGLSGSTVFFHIISQTVRFSLIKIMKRKICVLIFVKILPENFVFT